MALSIATPRRTLAMDDRPEHSEFRATFAGLLALTAVVSVFLLFFLVIYVQFGKGYWLNITLNHFPAVIGLPGAAAAAFVVVAVLRNTEGPIEFEGLGFKFKGASGPVILWMLCFLAVSGAIRLLWPLTTHWQ